VVVLLDHSGQKNEVDRRAAETIRALEESHRGLRVYTHPYHDISFCYPAQLALQTRRMKPGFAEWDHDEKWHEQICGRPREFREAAAPLLAAGPPENVQQTIREMLDEVKACVVGASSAAS